VKPLGTLYEIDVQGDLRTTGTFTLTLVLK
jgi:hypothetical protein